MWWLQCINISAMHSAFDCHLVTVQRRLTFHSAAGPHIHPLCTFVVPTMDDQECYRVLRSRRAPLFMFNLDWYSLEYSPEYTHLCTVFHNSMAHIIVTSGSIYQGTTELTHTKLSTLAARQTKWFRKCAREKQQHFARSLCQVCQETKGPSNKDQVVWNKHLGSSSACLSEGFDNLTSVRTNLVPKPLASQISRKF